MLSVSRKLDAVSIFGMMVSVSSTYLRQKEGSLPSRSRFSSIDDMNTLQCMMKFCIIYIYIYI